MSIILLIDITNELKAKLLAAKSAEEVAKLVKTISTEDAAHLWKEITKGFEQAGRELSLDELEAVSGGEEFSLIHWGKIFRDYAQEGCAATVEPDSHCWGTDGGCTAVDRFYSHKPIWVKCPDCGVYLYESSEKYGRCIVCGKSYSLEVSGPRIGSLN